MRMRQPGTATASPGDSERLLARARPAESPILHQVWRYLAFFHWPVDPVLMARLLPPGLSVDTFDGAAYVGIVPFTISRSTLARTRIPVAPAFHELNLRTYVHREGRSPGVWFFSLDAASRLAVAGARAGYGLPYFHARISLRLDEQGDRATVAAAAAENGGPTVAFSSRRLRKHHGEVFFRAEYRPTGPVRAAQPGTLEFFLLERYLLYASKNGTKNGTKHGTLRTARVHHAPYPVQDAVASTIDGNLAEAAGLTSPPGVVPLAHYAHEVAVDIFRPRR
jgi:uncharacterized protein YqjF (DUF2071 family)